MMMKLLISSSLFCFLYVRYLPWISLYCLSARFFCCFLYYTDIISIDPSDEVLAKQKQPFVVERPISTHPLFPLA